VLTVEAEGGVLFVASLLATATGHSFTSLSTSGRPMRMAGRSHSEILPLGL
jgi:hypothetical protein